MRSLFCTKPLSGILLGILKSRYTGGIHQISNYFAASISITRFWRFTGMADKMITRDQSAQELMELRWRINKLEEMKNCRGWVEHRLGTKKELLNQNQSSQFFLELKSYPVVQTKNNSRIEQGIYGEKGYKSK